MFVISKFVWGGIHPAPSTESIFSTHSSLCVMFCLHSIHKLILSVQIRFISQMHTINVNAPCVHFFVQFRPTPSFSPLLPPFHYMIHIYFITSTLRRFRCESIQWSRLMITWIVARFKKNNCLMDLFGAFFLVLQHC